MEMCVDAKAACNKEGKTVYVGSSLVFFKITLTHEEEFLKNSGGVLDLKD